MNLNTAANPGKRNSKGIRIYNTFSDKAYMAVIYIVLWSALILVAVPLIFIVSSSFSSADAIAAGKVILWPIGFNIKGYQIVFSSKMVLIGYRNSIIYTVLGTCLNVVMTMLAAYPLSRRDFQGRKVITILFSITMFFSGGMIPTYLLVRNLGLLNTMAAMIVPVAMAVWYVIITRTYLQSNIPTELYESASLDGCGDFYFLLRIVVPLSTPIIAVMVLLYAVGQWNSYMTAILYLNSPQLYPLQLVLRDVLILNLGLGNPTDVTKLIEIQYMSYLMKYSTIIVASVPVMLLYPFVQKYFIKGIMIGALKG